MVASGDETRFIFSCVDEGWGYYTKAVLPTQQGAFSP
jgi:hypothetical protein